MESTEHTGGNNDNIEETGSGHEPSIVFSGLIIGEKTIPLQGSITAPEGSEWHGAMIRYLGNETGTNGEQRIKVLVSSKELGTEILAISLDDPRLGLVPQREKTENPEEPKDDAADDGKATFSQWLQQAEPVEGGTEPVEPVQKFETAKEDQSAALIESINQQLSEAQKLYDKLLEKKRERAGRIRVLREEIAKENVEPSIENTSFETLKQEILKKIEQYKAALAAGEFWSSENRYIENKLIPELEERFEGKNPFKWFIADTLAPRVKELCCVSDSEITDDHLIEYVMSNGINRVYSNCDERNDNTVEFSSNGFLLQLENEDEVTKEEEGKKVVIVDADNARYTLVGPDGNAIETGMSWDMAQTRGADEAKAAFQKSREAYEQVKNNPHWQEAAIRRLAAEFDARTKENFEPIQKLDSEALKGIIETYLTEQAAGVKAFDIHVRNISVLPYIGGHGFTVKYEQYAEGKLFGENIKRVSFEFVAPPGRNLVTQEYNVSFSNLVPNDFRSSLEYVDFSVSDFVRLIENKFAEGRSVKITIPNDVMEIWK